MGRGLARPTPFDFPVELECTVPRIQGPDPLDPLALDEKLDDAFEVKGELGKGRFGAVCKLVEKHTGAEFACKIVDKGPLASSAEVSRKLRQEAELGRELSRDCEGVVRALRVLEDEDRLYLVMELCRGGTLAQYVDRRREQWAAATRRGGWAGTRAAEGMQEERMEALEVEAGWVIGELARALAHCHSKGVVHRDMKPENVLLVDRLADGEWVSGLPRLQVPETHGRGLKVAEALRFLLRKATKLMGSKVMPAAQSNPRNHPGTRLKIADLGLAERLGPRQSASRGVVGSFAYLAPEVARLAPVSDNLTEDVPPSQPVGFPSDVWGLGVILYVLLSDGHHPFSGRTTEMLLDNIRRAHVDFGAPKLAGVSPAGKDVLKSLLAPDPSARPSAAEVGNLPWVQEQRRVRERLVAYQAAYMG